VGEPDDNFDLLPEEQRVALLLRRLGNQLADHGMSGTAALCDRAAVLLDSPEAQAGRGPALPTQERLGVRLPFDFDVTAGDQ
jgi:hypothetical protein